MSPNLKLASIWEECYALDLKPIKGRGFEEYPFKVVGRKPNVAFLIIRLATNQLFTTTRVQLR